ncbi:putative sulfate exporter family transporter [Streptomyces sp. M600PL45_2]|uniref:Sulfate exporter family transporter n=1 Tax=Streptomyces marispadix TaxID=2922868 RepID=A0ABS9SWE6_9ACTN|nr:putative sulfate exporter family transporter [Streptomyces marispadix]MCH6160523.1 putative sulfate exporter family transporter [Streptomyces marispadix]
MALLDGHRRSAAASASASAPDTGAAAHPDTRSAARPVDPPVRSARATRPVRKAVGTDGPTRPARTAVRSARPASKLPGLALAALGVAAAGAVHLAVPAVPKLTAAVVLGILAAHLPGVRTLAGGAARPGLSLAGKRLMRLGVVLLGLKLSFGDILGLGWATVAMVLAVVAATFCGTLWLGRRLGLPGDQPLLIATGYSICGASAIGAVSEVRDSEERDVATSVALVTLCGTLAIAVLPLLHHPLGLDAEEFGRWVGAGVHDVGQVVATAQTAGQHALGQAVLVKLMRVALLAPLVAAVVLSVRARRRAAAEGPARTSAGEAAVGDFAVDGTPAGSGAAAGTGGSGAGGRRPPLVPLFVAGFLLMVAVRSTGRLSPPVPSRSPATCRNCCSPRPCSASAAPCICPPSPVREAGSRRSGCARGSSSRGCRTAGCW